jgi:hypothetical protein
MLVELLPPIIVSTVKLGLTSRSPTTIEKAFQTLAFVFKDLGRELAKKPADVWDYVREGFGAGLPDDSRAASADDAQQDQKSDDSGDDNELDDVEAEDPPAETTNGVDWQHMDVDDTPALPPRDESDIVFDVADQPVLDAEDDPQFQELETSTSTLKAQPRLVRAPKAQLRHFLASAFAFFVRKTVSDQQKLDELLDVILNELRFGSGLLAESVAWVISETCKVGI